MGAIRGGAACDRHGKVRIHTETDVVDEGAKVVAYDPAAFGEGQKLLPEVTMAADPYACIGGADAMIILTEWDEFRALDLDRIQKALLKPVVVDLRNVFKPDEMAERGFAYFSVGRPDSKPL